MGQTAIPARRPFLPLALCLLGLACFAAAYGPALAGLPRPPGRRARGPRTLALVPLAEPGLPLVFPGRRGRAVCPGRHAAALGLRRAAGRRGLPVRARPALPRGPLRRPGR